MLRPSQTMSRRKQSNPKPVKRDDFGSAMDEEVSSLEKSLSATDEVAPSPAPSSTNGSEDIRTLEQYPVKKEADENPPSVPSPDDSVALQSRKRKADDHSRPNSSTSNEQGPEDFPSALSQLINPDILQSLQYFALLRQSFPNGSLFNGPVSSSNSASAEPAPSLLPATKPMSDSTQSCPACGICFSSQSTLHAHLTYYCSQRPKIAADKVFSEKSTARSDTPETAAAATHSESPLDDVSAPKIRRSGRYYACPYCSFSADKRVSLNRHMRVHVGLPLLATHPISPPPEVVESRRSVELAVDPKLMSKFSPCPENAEIQADRFCQDCKIQFSSVTTYQVHKQHYCQMRNSLSGSQKSSPSPPKNMADLSIPRLILPTHPPIAIPLCIAQSAKILTPDDPMPPHAIIVSPEGELQFQRENLNESFPAPEVSIREEDEVIRSGQNSQASAEQPETDEALDLSSKHSKDSLNGDDRPKGSKDASAGSIRIREELARVQQSSTPAIPFLPPKVFAELEALGMCLGVPSGLEMASNPAQWLSMLENAVLSASSPGVSAPAAAQQAKPAMVPCEDCNISFRRMESYLVHRQFYCASRQREKAESTSSNRTDPPSDPTEDANREKPSKGPKIPCDQCGVEFESAHTLQAHKSYYCSKGTSADSVSVSSNEETEKTTQPDAPICKTEEPSALVDSATASTPTTAHPQHPNSGSPTAVQPSTAAPSQGQASQGWKCPCCDLLSPTAAAAQKHIETHSNVRAFRCSLCGYRGNTLRGMRTHVRIHFDRRITDQCEDNYISCILSPENSSTNGTGPSASSGDVEQLCRNLGIRPEVCAKILSSSAEASAAMLALNKLTNDGTNPSLAALQFLQLAQRMSSHSPGPTTGAGCRSDKLFLCDLCCYSSSYRGNVIRHSKLVHGREINDVAVVASNFLQASKPNLVDHIQQQQPKTPSPRILTQNEKVSLVSSPPAAEQISPIKKEPETGSNSPKLAIPASAQSPSAEANENMQKHCKSCNITFNYMSTFLAHKKYYCSSHTSEAGTPSEATHA